MPDLSSLCIDLRAEHVDLDAIVSPLAPARWDEPTPAEPWTVRDQIGHLAFFDEQALRASSEPDLFAADLVEIADDVEGFVNAPLEKARSLTPAELLEWWRAARTEMLDAFAGLDPAARIPWFGPAMSPASFISARLMETWAHGQDVADGLGVRRVPTERLRHVAHIGVRARPFSYVANGRTMPETDVRVELTSPSGEQWVWGDDGSTDTVRGSALSFCLVVTQRRHPEDTDLRASGDAAREWIEIAQCFAGPPGTGRKPGQFERIA